MNKSRIMAAFTVAAVLGTAGSAYAVPEVSGVTMTQITGTRQVRITYDLAKAEAIITLSIETNGVAIPDSAVTRLTGAVCKEVAIGTGHTIMWNAGADWPENITATAKARVTAWSVDAPPQYCAVDLSGGPSVEKYPVLYYMSAEALPYGITNVIYKNSYLVMSKIANGAFNMGEGTCGVTLKNDFYTGVFQVTQGQWAQVMGTSRSAFFTDVSSKLYRPMEQVSYHDIRENPSGAGSAITPNWPQSDEVGADSFMGLLQLKTGLAGFDLPTEAQWEYACRAGTTSYYNDSLGTPGNTTSNAQMNVLGRYERNGGKVWNGSSWVNSAAGCDPENGTAIVGSYLPNDWGLYDMHGNVREWCLDWNASSLSGGEDPKGADSGSIRVFRGGCWYYPALDCRSASRDYGSPSARSSGVGFRLVRTLP